MIKITLKNNKGYTLLFAVIVASVILSVGISILNISKKEFLLAASARESVTAFYAADSGLECAIYNKDEIATSTPGGSTISCMGQSVTDEPDFPNTFPGGNDGYGVFYFNIKTANPNSSDKSCVVIKVEKFYEKDENNNYVPATTIESRGYNMGWTTSNNTCSVNSPKRVERAIRYSF